jgi:hypothetical protein
MAITYGFFNSLNGDRTYDADQMSEYFDGLVSNGVYESVGGGLQVLAVSEGMAVNVSTGRALINCKWLNNSAVLTLDITAAHAILNRWTAVIVRLDIVNRLMTITTKDGTPATDPVKPPMQNDASMVEMCLAYVYVAADSGSISQADITDMRGTNLCGWVTGLIEQVDTATLFLQWQTAFNNYYQQMTSAFNDWFNTLTDELQVNTFIQKFSKNVVLATGVSNIIPLNMTGYTYDGSDIINVYINGLYDNSYTLNTSGETPTITVGATAEGTEINIVILKTKIGFDTLSDGTNAITTDSNEEIIV